MSTLTSPAQDLLKEFQRRAATNKHHLAPSELTGAFPDSPQQRAFDELQDEGIIEFVVVGYRVGYYRLTENYINPILAEVEA